ncbi:hypothetical protein GCM10022291_11670 [Postechiella marina]|uniref:Alpha-ketoglutarate decarboxylase n=1 Tax=Postechiella marina TaxID=943941 RepID=A0ABP8C4Y0_9FLAO
MGLINGIIKKGVLILSIFLFFANSSNAQEYKSDFWEHVRFGGSFGLNFANDFFSATIAPSAIYQVDEKLAFGVGLNATFNSQKDIYKSTILGGSLIGLYNPFNAIQLSAEFEELNVNRKYDSSLNIANNNYWTPALFLGAGYRQGNITLGVRYDVLHDKDKSIYVDAWAPFVRFYF